MDHVKFSDVLYCPQHVPSEAKAAQPVLEIDNSNTAYIAWNTQGPFDREA
jgi:hypothetical protein